mmetsp:Transcript_23093/g.41306  ORF Transcript_23093/g.41306 Transcript_23093/m.41306 type:complete len:111 (+) Transcript_23093:50-382(+)
MPWQVAPGLVIIGGAFSVTGSLLYLLQGLEKKPLRQDLFDYQLQLRDQRIFDQIKQGQLAAMAPVYDARELHKKKLEAVATIATGREGDYVHGKGEAGGHTGFAEKDAKQ